MEYVGNYFANVTIVFFGLVFGISSLVYFYRMLQSKTGTENYKVMVFFGGVFCSIFAFTLLNNIESIAWFCLTFMVAYALVYLVAERVRGVKYYSGEH